jgi:pyridinium-3,5-bisthiocarboxylic acid mononucleotide nickel chelatase
MRIAYLDCFSGISGDMFLGALVDAGVSTDLLKQTVSSLGIGARLEISRVNCSGISATKVNVLTGDAIESMVSASDIDHNHSHSHEHSHTHDHRPHANSTPEHHHRGLKEIRGIIQKAGISKSAKMLAISMFEALGAAEAKIHNSDIEKIHFHEVGAVDAIVDIVCAVVGAQSLGVDEFICSRLNVGGGMVQCAHGNFPVPAPATLELLKDAPVYSSGIQAELVTPTGAVIVKTLANRFAAFPEMKIRKIGYGAGTRDFAGHANVLRLTIGDALVSARETITVLEANIDDLNPQVVGYAMERAFSGGALDAFVIPVQMKKNRPGMLLTVLCRNEDAPQLTEMIFSETSTLGVRRRTEERVTLTREWVDVTTEFGDIRIKVGRSSGIIMNFAAEYEDCKKIAIEKHVPLKRVMQSALDVFTSMHGDVRVDPKVSDEV